MLGVGEHIDRLDAAELIAAGEEYVEVAALSIDIAGDIDDAPRCAFEQRGEKALVAPGTGRVHENNIGPHLICRHLLHVFPGVADGEPAVFDAVQSGVCYRVVHRVAVYLDADDLLCLIRGAEADGADAAVGVEHGLGSGETGKADGGGIELLGLDGVYLIERAGGDAEALAAEHVLDIAAAVDDFLARAEDDRAEAVVDIENDGGDLRVLFQQLLEKGLLEFEYR